MCSLQWKTTEIQSYEELMLHPTPAECIFDIAIDCRGLRRWNLRRGEPRLITEFQVNKMRLGGKETDSGLNAKGKSCFALLWFQPGICGITSLEALARRAIAAGSYQTHSFVTVCQIYHNVQVKHQNGTHLLDTLIHQPCLCLMKEKKENKSLISRTNNSHRPEVLSAFWWPWRPIRRGIGTHGVMNKQMAVHWCHHPLPHGPTEPYRCVCVCLHGLSLLEGDFDQAAAWMSTVFERYDKSSSNEEIRSRRVNYWVWQFIYTENCGH